MKIALVPFSILKIWKIWRHTIEPYYIHLTCLFVVFDMSDARDGSMVNRMSSNDR
jgi:hypothetical protein